VLGDDSLGYGLAHGTERILEALQTGLELISGFLHSEQLRVLWAGYEKLVSGVDVTDVGVSSLVEGKQSRVYLSLASQ
jgi:hypothetical protein